MNNIKGDKKITTEQLFQTIEDYLEDETDYNVLEVFAMFNDTTLTLSSDKKTIIRIYQ